MVSLSGSGRTDLPRIEAEIDDFSLEDVAQLEGFGVSC